MCVNETLTMRRAERTYVRDAEIRRTQVLHHLEDEAQTNVGGGAFVDLLQLVHDVRVFHVALEVLEDVIPVGVVKVVLARRVEPSDGYLHHMRQNAQEVHQRVRPFTHRRIWCGGVRTTLFCLYQSWSESERMASVLVRMSIKSPSMRLYSSESTYHTSAQCGELASNGGIGGFSLASRYQRRRFEKSAREQVIDDLR